MKIAVNGNIIDTENIYKITKVEIDNIIEESENRFAFYKGHWITISFKIKIFNNKDIQILESLRDFNSFINYKNDKFNSIQKLNKFRDSIIEIWSENQSEIPQFNV
jgi:hypothetical protein